MGVKTQALKELHLAWAKKIQAMKTMNQAISVHPIAPEQVFRPAEQSSEEMVKVDCGPAVFNLCERAGDLPTMYVVVEGSISLEESGRTDTPLRTTGFGTKVGYFRSRRNRLEHVYGVHYDMDEGGDGHPVFHSQLGPMEEFGATVCEHYRLNAEIVDHVGKMLRNVRTPSAQMDFFSVFTQLCADHLIGMNRGGADPQVVNAFGRVRSACNFLQGAAHRFAFLGAGNARECYRSSRWYGDS